MTSTFILVFIFTIIVFLILSAMFASAETAYLASSKAKLHKAEQAGDKRAKTVTALRDNMGRLLSSLLVGNTLVNVFATSIATWFMVEIFGDQGAAYTPFIIGTLIIIYGEVMPKIFAVTFPEPLALFLAPVMRVIVMILTPFTKILEQVSRKSLGLFGVKVSSHSSTTTEEELRGLIDLHVGPDEETSHERAMLRAVLDLNSVDVEEIMVHRKNIFMLDINLGSEKIVEQMLQSPYSRVPLWRENAENIVGVLHVRALFAAMKEVAGDVSSLNLYQIAAKPWFIPETTGLLDQLQEFRKRKEHMALVVDEYGSLEGLVTLEDIIEEIVGEIEDEHDIYIDGVRKSSDGSITVLGSVTIRDLNRQFEWDLPDEEASTIAGLVIHETRTIPEQGQVFKLNGFKIEVLRRQRNQITLLRLHPPKEDGSSL